MESQKRDLQPSQDPFAYHYEDPEVEAKKEGKRELLGELEEFLLELAPLIPLSEVEEYAKGRKKSIGYCYDDVQFDDPPGGYYERLDGERTEVQNLLYFCQSMRLKYGVGGSPEEEG